MCDSFPRHHNHLNSTIHSRIWSISSPSPSLLPPNQSTRWTPIPTPMSTAGRPLGSLAPQQVVGTATRPPHRRPPWSSIATPGPPPTQARSSEAARGARPSLHLAPSSRRARASPRSRLVRHTRSPQHKLRPGKRRLPPPRSSSSSPLSTRPLSPPPLQYPPKRAPRPRLYRLQTNSSRSSVTTMARWYQSRQMWHLPPPHPKNQSCSPANRSTE